MILLISTCQEKLHELEFVKPVEKIVGKCVVKHYLKVSEDDLIKADKVIVCGTSLSDNFYLENLEKVSWIKTFEKPILGICAGSHIIQLIFGGINDKFKEIGKIVVNFEKEFLGVNDKIEVYSLHQNFVKSNEFEVYARSGGCIHAVKHKEKDIYGVLFHPEVYNPSLINKFVTQ